MAERTTTRILQWLGTHCAAHRFRAATRQRDQLLRKLGCLSGAAARHRLPCGAWKAHGEVAYRRFKWDPTQLPVNARVLCRQLMLLESSLSRLARQFGAGPNPALPRPASPYSLTFRAGGIAEGR